MDLFQRRPLSAVVEVVMEALGQRAPIDQIMQGVRGTATKDEWESWADSAMTGEVRNKLRSKTGAQPLPDYLEVHGYYTALTLFSPEEYEDKARSYAKLSRANRDKVFACANACQEAHGTSFDAEKICREFGLAA